MDKESVPDNWVNSEPIQIVKKKKKDAKIRRFTVRKVCSGDKPKGVSWQPLASAEEVRH